MSFTKARPVVHSLLLAMCMIVIWSFFTTCLRKELNPFTLSPNTTVWGHIYISNPVALHNEKREASVGKNLSSREIRETWLGPIQLSEDVWNWWFLTDSLNLYSSRTTEEVNFRLGTGLPNGLDHTLEDNRTSQTSYHQHVVCVLLHTYQNLGVHGFRLPWEILELHQNAHYFVDRDISVVYDRQTRDHYGKEKRLIVLVTDNSI